MPEIAAALRRVESVLERRPAAAIHDDAPATCRWQGGVRMATSHANGARIATDMPVELGGTGDQVSPGWLFRAGLASCTATVIAMRAAAAGIDLAALEVHVTSRSDARGILGMKDAGGDPVGAGPGELRMNVRIAARGVPQERLRDLVEESQRCSPIYLAVRDAVPVDVRVQAEAA